MTENPTTFLQTILLILFFWILIGIIGYEPFEKFLVQLLKGQTDLFERFRHQSLELATTILRYFNATDIEIIGRINRNANWDSVAESVTTIEIIRFDKPIIANRIKIERITGALLGIISTELLIYGLILYTTSTMEVLYLLTNIPAWLDISPITRNIIIVIGIISANGLYISDIISTTNFTNSIRFKGTWKKVVLIIRITSIIISILIFSTVAIKDPFIGAMALLFLPIPLILTLSLSLDLLTGSYVITSIFSYILSFTFFMSSRLVSFLIQLVISLTYLQCLLFEKIVLSPVKVISNAFRNRK